MNTNCVKTVSKNPVNGIHLFLRNSIYYARIPFRNCEYKRISLKTDSYTFAWRKVMEMVVNQEEILERIKFLLSNLKFVGQNRPIFSNGQFYSMANSSSHPRLDKNNDIYVVKEAIDLAHKAENIVVLNPDDRKLIEEFISMRPMLEDFVKIIKSNKGHITQTINNEPELSSYKIIDVLNSMITRQQNVESVARKKQLAIEKMLNYVQLSLEDAYVSFYDAKIIDKISEYIKCLLAEILSSTNERILKYCHMVRL